MADEITTQPAVSEDDIVTALTERFFDIPFENSEFQTKVFNITAEKTPGRAYRAIGLRMHSKLAAIQELKYTQMEQQIDLDEHHFIVCGVGYADKFALRRAEVNIERVTSTQAYTKKLLNDAVVELNYLYAELMRYPKYTREEFEDEELLHFKASLASKMTLRNDPVLDSLDSIKRYEGLTNKSSIPIGPASVYSSGMVVASKMNFGIGSAKE